MTRRVIFTTALLAAGSIATAAALPRPQGDEPARRQMVIEIRGGEADPQVLVLGDGEPMRLRSWAARRGFLGVGLVDLTPELRAHFGAGEDAGVLMSRIEPDTPAERAGLAVGDVLVSIDGQPVRSAAQASRRIGLGNEGDRIELAIVRDRAPLALVVELAATERRQLDLGALFCAEGEPCPPATDGLPTLHRRVLPIDPERLNDAMSRLNAELESPEWRERMLRFRGGYEGLEERIRELEERLERLQQELDRLPE